MATTLHTGNARASCRESAWLLALAYMLVQFYFHSLQPQQPLKCIPFCSPLFPFASVAAAAAGAGG